MTKVERYVALQSFLNNNFTALLSDLMEQVEAIQCDIMGDPFHMNNAEYPEYEVQLCVDLESNESWLRFPPQDGSPEYRATAPVTLKTVPVRLLKKMCNEILEAAEQEALEETAESQVA